MVRLAVDPPTWAAGSIPTLTVDDATPGVRVILRVGHTAVWTGITDRDGHAEAPRLSILGRLPPGGYAVQARVPADWPHPPAVVTVRVAVTSADTRLGSAAWAE